MTVGRLLEALSSFDPDTPIKTAFGYTDWEWSEALEMSEELTHIEWTANFIVEPKKGAILLGSQLDIDEYTS